MSAKFELMVAPNGARLTKADHPAVPCSARELAATIKACADAGATAAHLHVRDEQGRHSLDPALYAEALAAIRALTPIPLQISTESGGIFDVRAQIDCLDQVKPADASVSLREMARAPDLLGTAYRIARKNGTDIQHILYSADDLVALLARFKAGDIPTTFRRVIFVLGSYADRRAATPADLDPFLAALNGHDLTWSACAFGPREQDCLLAALDQGGHVRIGFENNTIAPDGRVFADNAASVSAFVKAAAKAGFQPTGPTS